ncbi:low temperature requirement protein A [Naasia sp. SYSU D00057]|uniref:low temperature requirement protein A n=1 Tax=Naasia sp. SYSU D00057 TaxID=2817380 RepID=UPI001B3144F6|nr:low temperature requirement protein A [Naasia sp. SYSU D00057]
MRLGLRRDISRSATEAGEKASFIELFFDLVFVLAVTQVAHTVVVSLEKGETLLGLLEAAVLVLALWWVWVYTAWITNWLNPETAPVRGLLLVLMLVGLLMSTSIPEAFAGRGLIFALAYVTMQVGRSLFAAFAMARHNPDGASNLRRLALWFSLGGVFWIVGGVIADPWIRLGLWALAIAIDYGAASLRYRLPWFKESASNVWDLASAHLAERTALFMIIAFGEGILVTGSFFAEHEITPEGVTAFLAAITGTVLLWLVYFNRAERRGRKFMEESDESVEVARYSYTYVHVVLVVGVVLVAVSDELLLAHPLEGTGGYTPLLIYAAPAIYLVGNVWFKKSTGTFPLASHLVGILPLMALALLVPLLAPRSSPLLHAWVANALVLAVLIFEEVGVRRARARTGGRDEQPDELELEEPPEGDGAKE